MRVMKWSAIALAVTAGTSQLAMASAQSESNGFIEDANATVLLRNAFFNRDYKDGLHNQRAWAQAFIGTFESGFTQGTVGVGVDAFGLLGVKLDGGAGRAGDNNLGGFLDAEYSPNSKGVRPPKSSWGRAGGAVKARISNTVLKYGEQMPVLPVLSRDDSRVLPQTFTGTLLTSNEIEGLEVNLGHFTADSPMHSAVQDGGNLKSIDIAGLSYAFTDNLNASLYWSDIEDVAKKKYANVNYNIPLTSDQALNFDFNIYDTDYDKRYTGSGKSEDNTIWSLATKYSIGAHAFTLAHQRSTGDRGYEYDIGDGGSAIWLANSYYSDFNQKDERSWQVRYDVDFASYGIPGLSYTAAYIRGNNIDTGTDKNAHEREIFNQVSYVVQEGMAKDLSFRLRNSIYRNSNSNINYSGDVDEIRLFIEYPLSIL